MPMEYTFTFLLLNSTHLFIPNPFTALRDTWFVTVKDFTCKLKRLNFDAHGDLKDGQKSWDTHEAMEWCAQYRIILAFRSYYLFFVFKEPRDWLSWQVFCGFLQCLQASAGIVPKIGPWLLPSISSSYSLFTNHPMIQCYIIRAIESVIK
jgi:hypothetical protein